MPTGYTASIKDGISFETFAMDCARAFGACVTLRDEPGGGERIPEKFRASDYHLKRLIEAQSEIKRINRLSAEERALAAMDAHRKAEEERLTIIKERIRLRDKYRAMLAKVDSWIPPTPDHEELKRFMVQQIEQSIDADCDTSYFERATERQSGKEWAECQIERLEKSIEYQESCHAEEEQRARQRTAWVSALRASLGIN